MNRMSWTVDKEAIRKLSILSFKDPYKPSEEETKKVLRILELEEYLERHMFNETDLNLVHSIFNKVADGLYWLGKEEQTKKYEKRRAGCLNAIYSIEMKILKYISKTIKAV